MRIIHIIDYFQPKLGYQEAFLAREHSNLGHEVYVVTSDRYNPKVYSGKGAKAILGERVVGSGFFIEEGIKVWRLKALFEIKNRIWVLGLEKKVLELKPDLVIMHGIVNLLTWRLARLKRKGASFKLIYDDHMTSHASRNRLRFLYPLFKLAFSHLLQETADALVGVCDSSKRFMHERYGIPLERISVITLGADDVLFRKDASARKDLREKLAINDKDIVFIYTGKIIPEKGPSILVEAALQVMKKQDNLKVILVGSGSPSYMQEMKRSIKDNGMESNFTWLDEMPNRELYKFYSAADVAVWPREASLSMIEAMACSLPIIISDTSEVTERLAYNNGLTYRGDDPLDLAQKMTKLLDSGLRRDMGLRGRKFVEEELSWRKIAKKFLISQ